MEARKQEVKAFQYLNDSIDVELVFLEDIIPYVSDDYNGKILLKDGEVDCPDYVFVRAFDLGDRQYQLNAILDMFEQLGVVCINSTETKHITSDKLLTLQIANSVCENIKIPKTILVTPDISAGTIGEIIGFPLVIKLMHGSKGKGVSLIKSEKELDNLLSMVFAAPFDDQILAQEAIQSSRGKDLRLTFAFGKCFDSFVRVNDTDFKSNVSTGGHIEKIDVPQFLIDDSLKFAEAIDLKLGSIDFLFGEKEDEFYLCEANSTIGMPYIMDGFKDGNLESIEQFKNLFNPD